MDDSELIALAARHHKIDVPVQAIRKDGEDVVIVIQGGAELKCKLSELQDVSSVTYQVPGKKKAKHNTT
jgi:hypothetical protein